MKSLDLLHVVKLLTAILADAGLACRASLSRDLQTLESRIEHEGLSFVTITLPNYAKAFEKCLEQSRIDPSMFAGFKSASKLPFPAFLQGLVGLVFNVDGVLHNAPNIDAIEGVRQICLAFNKIKIKCTASREKAAEEQFIATDREVSGFRVRSIRDCNSHSYVSNILFGRIFDHISDEISNLRILPKHGPGSTQDRTIGNRKFCQKRTTVRLERTFPSDWYQFFNFQELADELSDTSLLGKLDVLDRRSEPPVRVVFVPKTMKTPRVIAIEPVWTQFIQQGLMREFISCIERDSILSGRINFTDQSINRNLALESSLSKSHATIDLSEASDRVHPSLVANMMRYHTVLSRAIFSCRSERAMLPSGRVINLSKFASQGSALCFPMEAMVFYSIIVTRIVKHRNLRLNRANIHMVARSVYVYGDDIIVPTREVQVAIEALEDAGLKVNRKKTFSEGNFRESCGMDAYMGVNVTPIYIRNPLPHSKCDAASIESTISTANLFYKKGYWRSASFLRLYVEKIIGVVPHVSSTSSVSGWFSFRGRRDHHKWCSDTHSLLVRGPSISARSKSDPIDGYQALMKWATMRTSSYAILGIPNPLDSDSFSRSTVRGKLKMNFRWSPT